MDDALLEAELGLDSLKMIGLWNNLFELLPPERVEAFAEANPAQDLARFQTLGDLLDFFAEALQRLSGASHASGQPAAQVPGAAPVAAAAAVPGRPFPLAPAQQLFLVTHQMLDSTSLCTSVRLKGAFSLDRARAAWQALTERHVNLRTVFHIPGGTRSFSQFEYRLLDAPQVPPVGCLDISNLSCTGQAGAIDAEFTRLLNRPWSLTQWPLHAFSVARLGADEHVVFLANEHIVSDGLSNQLLMREFLALYHALAGGPALSAAVTAQHHREQLERIAALASPAEAEAYDRYSKATGRETCSWNPDGLERTYTAPQFRNLPAALDVGTTAALQALAGAWGVSLYAVLLSTFIEVVGSFEPQRHDDLVLQLPTSGNLYPGIDVAGIAGCFAQVLSLRVPRSAGPGAEAARALHDQVEHALLAGYDREATRRLAASMGRDFVLKDGRVPEYLLGQMRKGLKSNLYVPFTGRTHIQPRYGELEVTDYRAGTSNAAGTIDLLHEIHGDRLHLFVNWDREALRDATAAQLMQRYIERLGALARAGAAPVPAAEARAQALGQPSAAALRDVLALADTVLALRIAPSDATADLEATLGVDSLERVRLCLRVAQAWKIEPQPLLRCRTLVALACCRPQAVALPVPLAAAAAGGALDAAVIGQVQALDSALAPMPILHIVQQVARTPQALAVTSRRGDLSYRELDAQSNRLARHLREGGVGRGDLVAVICDRGPNLLVAIVGILKAGAGYVPVDPGYPAQRMQYIVGHAQVRHLVYESCAIDIAASLPAVLHGEVELIALDAGSEPAWQRCSAEPVEPVSQPDDLMVVLYTSGSTGQPKGVALGHRGYMNRLQWHHDTFQLPVGGRVAQKTSCCFDISVWELLWPLMVGGTVCAVDREVVLDPWGFAAWMREQHIQVAHFVPSMFTEFVQALGDAPPPLPDLRWLIFSGEALAVPPVQRWIDHYGLSVGLANLYGPTEASIDVSCHLVTARPQALRIPIGAPIANTQMIVVDANGRALPPGEMGELCLGGVQLAQGYLHDPVKTDAAFVPNRHARIEGARLYRTGDLAVELPNGEFDYRGRLDGQIKIRGFRVELGEIEAVLEAHPAVREAAVLALPVRGTLKLIAWVALADATLGDDALKDALRLKLPDYMIPHQLRREAVLPKNHNGKLDRGVLRQRFEAGDAAPAELALAPAQKWLVHHYDEPFQWWGTTRLRYQGRLEIDAFIAAIDAVVAAHPALRTTFHRGAAGWHRRIAAEVPSVAPQFFDARDLAPQGVTAWLQQRVVEAAESLRIDRYPLLKIMMVAVADEAWEFVVVVHHLIGDLVAGNVMFRTLWKHYDDLVAGRPVQPRPVPGTDELVRLLQAQPAQEVSRQLDYWQQQFPSPDAGFLLPYDHLLGENDEASSEAVELRLTKAQTQALLSTTKNHHDSPLYALLVAPLYRALADAGRAGRVVLSHRVHGRDALPNRVFIDSFDNFAVNYPLALEVEPGEPMGALIGRFRAAQDAVPLRGVSYDWLAERLPNYLYPDHRLTSVRVNYLGNLSLASNPRFVVNNDDNNQRLARPHQKRSAMVEVWLSIVEGALEVRIGYSRHFHTAATVRALGDAYLALVRNMIDESSLQPA